MMSFCEGFSELDGDVERSGWRQRRFLFDDLCQLDSFDQFHDQEWRLPFDSEVESPCDSWMMKLVG